MVIEALVSVVDAIRNSTILKSIREMARITDENNQYLDNKMDTVTTAASEATTAANQATAKLDEKVTEINTAVNNVNTAVNTVNGYNTRLTTVETISASNTERIIDNEAGIEALEDELGSSDLPGTVYYKIDQLETAETDNFKKTSTVTQKVTSPTIFSGGLDVTTNDNSIKQVAITYADITNMDVSGKAVVPTTPATTTSAVNQAYVESTVDGVNNITHKTGTETIAGNKTYTGKLFINGEYNNKSVLIAGLTSTWVRVYELKAPNNQVLNLIVNGQKGNNYNCFGILSLFLSTSVSINVLGNFSDTYKTRICAVKKVSDATFEIWAYCADGNTGIMFSRLGEYNWGQPSNYLVMDGVTQSTTFDPTDTSLYSAYSYLGGS